MSPRVLTYEEIGTATENFNVYDMVSEDTSGKTYNGKFKHEESFGPYLHAKKFDIEVSKEVWQDHVTKLGNLKHKRLAELFGHCCEDKHRILVYRYKRGSLKYILSKKQLTLTERIKIVKAASKGLMVLLEHKQHIHRECVNTSNILVKYSGKAMLTVHFDPRNEGDIGEADVIYEYGLVLLEILTNLSRDDLTVWIGKEKRVPKDIVRVMDKRLEGQYSKYTATTAATLAFKCLRLVPDEDIKTMVSLREELKALKKIDSAVRDSITSTVKHMRSDR